MPDTSFHEDVEIALGVRATGLGVIEAKLDDEAMSNVEIMSNTGLVATVCATDVLAVLPTPDNNWWFPGPTAFDARLEEIASGIGRLAPLHPDTVFFLTGPAGDLGDVKAYELVVDSFRSLAREADRHGTRLAVEPMRPELRPYWTLVSTLAECARLIEDVGEPNFGIVFDIWHMWDSPDVFEQIPDMVGRIFGVQVSDYRQPPRGPRDRVIAGDGAADVQGVVGALVEAGYDGWFDMELFSDDGRFGYDYPDSLWKLPPREFAARQVEGFLRCYPD